MGKTTTGAGKFISETASSVGSTIANGWNKIDWDAVGTTLAVIGTAAAIGAFVIGTGGTGAVLLATISTVSTVVGTGISTYQTKAACEGAGWGTQECSAGAINTAAGAFPALSLFGKGKRISNIALTRKNGIREGTVGKAFSEANAKQTLANSLYLGGNTAGIASIGLNNMDKGVDRC